eukprot:TRINITY_DN319_c0_g1_i2.p1 TRINITY_DN319_c0_g1~~TRINITY_DN319_c0_g1_i2.p1  ORF type:complete len:201 (+),score=71.09 TRINITY_DN319_c0_g1_i2:495-1097(+)
MFEKVVVIDCRDHILGRLASTIAKELLNGQHVVAVRCEDINITGALIRNRFKYVNFLRKRMATNPKKGPFHFRAPSRMLFRTVRGMIPHKTSRGAAALERLKVFEGVPPPYDKVKRVVVPQALRVNRLRPNRKYTVLGDLAKGVGWKYSDIVGKLEEKRKIRSAAYYQRKKALNKLRNKAVETANKAAPDAAKTLAAHGL